MNTKTIKITLYINECDQWEHRPLYLEIMQMLQKNGISGGTVLHAIAGFTRQGHLETTGQVDVKSKLPLVIEFIDTAEIIEPILPQLKKMAGQRLITREPIEVLNYGKRFNEKKS